MWPVDGHEGGVSHSTLSSKAFTVFDCHSYVINIIVDSFFPLFCSRHSSREQALVGCKRRAV